MTNAKVSVQSFQLPQRNVGPAPVITCQPPVLERGAPLQLLQVISGLAA